MRFNSFSPVLIFVVFHMLLTCVVNAQSEGRYCSTKSGTSGTCKSIHECNLWSIYEEVNLCPSNDDSIIVCCPKQQQQQQQRQLVSISTRKCKEYTKAKCDFGTVPLLYGGDIVTDVNELPFMALLGYTTGSQIKWECGGALISEQFILTAAHCLTGSDRAQVSVAHLGFLNQRSRFVNTLQQFNVVQTFRHPNRTLRYRYHDIALLKLDRPVQFTDAVYPACLHEDTEIEIKTVQAAGWGQTETSSISEDLRKVDLDVISHQECASHYKYEKKYLPQGILDEYQLCAGSKGKDTCQGDSGGPTVISDGCIHSVVGITSVGISCGDVPGAYTRVSSYVRWIESIVWPEK